jgi:hypothetical protein
MAIELMNLAWLVKGITPMQKLVLMDLADSANRDTRQCWPSVDRITERTGAGRRTVFDALDVLEGRGLISREQRHNRSTVYTVLLQMPSEDVGAKSAPTRVGAPSAPAGAPAALVGAPPAPLEVRQPHTEPSLEPSKEPPRNRHGSRKCPADFVITPAMREWAKTEAPDVNLDREMVKLRDYEFRTPRKDWPATWRNWMRTAQESAQRRPIRKAAPDRLWDQSKERFVDTADLKPWEIERLQRANEAQASFENGAVNA